MALDIKSGDEIIVPDLTWVATANAVRYVGATPVFADIELDSWNVDANSIESLITDKTKAIIVVHLYGYPARMDRILEVANKYKLKIINYTLVPTSFMYICKNFYYEIYYYSK